MNAALIKQIDEAVKELWLTDICHDYEKDYLLREDSLKASLYYHLRARLNNILETYHLRIFPEFYFSDLKYRADMVLVQMKEESEEYYLKDRVEEILIVFELKYIGNGHTDDATDQWIKKDLDKCRRYIEEGKLKAHFCFGIIYENERATSNWMDDMEDMEWAKGRVTELNASLQGDGMVFDVYSL